MTNIFKPINAGKMRQRVTIQRPVDTPDNMGGATRAWADVETVWAQVQTISADRVIDMKQFRDSQYLSQQWFNVMIRYQGTVDTTMRLNYGGRFLVIYSVVDLDVLRWQINIFAREGG